MRPSRREGGQDGRARSCPGRPLAAGLAAVEAVDLLDVAAARARSRTARSSPRIRAGVVDFGKTMLPRWMCQRSTTWAGDVPTPLGDLGDHRVVEHVALRDRRPRLGRDAVRLAVRAHLVVGEVRVQLDLVDRRHDVGLGGQALEVRDLEVRDADRAGAAVALELLERLPRRDEVAVVERRQRPVDEEQVDVVEAERRQRPVERARARRRARWKPLLSLLVTKTSPRSRPDARTRLADARLVAVHLGGVDVAVADLERRRAPPRAVSSGGIWKTPKPSWGIAWPSLSSIVPAVLVSKGISLSLRGRPAFLNEAPTGAAS